MNPALLFLPRNRDDNVEDAFNAILYNLHEDHAEVRLGAFTIVEYLFGKSGRFKQLLIDHLDEFFAQCIGAGEDTEDDEPNAGQKKKSTKLLPPPRDKADLLQRRAAEFFLKWKDGVGVGVLPKIDLGYKFLVRSRQVEFSKLESRIRKEWERKAEAERKALALKRRKVEQISEELTGEVEKRSPPLLNHYHTFIQLRREENRQDIH